MKRVRSWIGAAALSLLAACGEGGGGGGSSSTPTPPPAPPPPPPPTSTAQVDATVIDTFGRAVSAAAVTSGTASVNTDAAGHARIAVPTGSERVVKIAKEGFAEQFKVVNLSASATAAQLEAMLIARETAQTIAAIESGGSATGLHGVKVTFPANALVTAAGQPVSGDVPSALQILRILQEVLTNVLKHAQARTIHIATEVTASSIAVIVGDDGVGFDTRRSYAGRGLKNLARRAADIGGEVTIASSSSGTVVRLELPVTRDSP